MEYPKQFQTEKAQALTLAAKFTGYFFAAIYLTAPAWDLWQGLRYDWLLPYEVALCLGLSGVFFVLSGVQVYKVLRSIKK